MIRLPACYDVIVKVTFKKLETIQRVNLTKIMGILDRLPGAKLDMLVYRPNKVYGWCQINNISVQDRLMSCCWYSTTTRGMNILIPYKFKYSFASLPSDFFTHKKLSPQEFALGLFILDNLALEIHSPFNGPKTFSMSKYINRQDELNKYDVKWTINQRLFDYRYHINNIDNMINDMVRDDDIDFIQRVLTRSLISK